MNMKKLSAIALSVIMATAVLASCTGGPAPSNNDTTPSNTDTASKAGDTGTTLATPSWKTDTAPITVKWFLSYDWYGKKFAPETNTFDKWVQDETGVTIEFQTGDTDKFNVLISTDSLPDIITTDANTSQRTMLENNGKLLPMNELRDKYAPDFIVPESMIEWYTAPDKNWYSYCNFYYGDDNTSANKGFYETHNQNFARKDILDKIGMKADDMRTKDGFLKALRAVKAQNIEYGGQKVIPYMGLFTIGDKVDEQLAEQFGASMEDKDGNFRSIYRAPEYLEALKFYNLLYREGLMTDETFTVKKDQLEQKVASGQLFATTRWTNVSISRNTLTASDPNALFLYAGMMHGDNHDTVAVAGKDNAGWAATMINHKAEKPERIIQMFAFMPTQEYTLNNEWGVDGYDIVDGHVERKPDFAKMAAEQPAEYLAKYGADIAWISEYTHVQGTYPVAKTEYEKDVVAKTHDAAIQIFDDKCFMAVAPEAGSEEASILSRVNEYKQQALSRILTAKTEAECEKLYNDAITEMEGLGLKKLETYQNTKFQANKQKLGLKFAHPFNQ